ncbi:ABC transporter permease [Microbacterium sp.]|uniref:ABC transporter permease n=1 Tax=Microbacterium sp. TaxID=51671 RepID=UPI002D76FDAA|nr:ABC transporter permease [Microbacterium sp.]HET6302079.1 ABC transporter permease [Microbacterium sp.]
MPKPRSSSLTTGPLWRARAVARVGLLASAAATVEVAVSTVCLVPAALARAAGEAGHPPPPGLSAEDVADQIALGATALATATPALVLLVAILAGTAIAQLARLIAAARDDETATIRARGLSWGQARLLDAGEALVVVVAGGIVGVALAAAIAAIAGGSALEALAQWPFALAAVVVLGVVFAVALRRGERRAGSTRTTRATTAALVVVVLLAAALVVWQLPAARAGGFDPIVAIAPAVVLMAGALVALALFGAASAVVARPSAAIPSLAPAYPVRQVSRRVPIYAVAVLLVGLTVAETVFASAYAATWSAMTTDSAAVRTGADLRVDTKPQSVNPGQVLEAASIDGIDAASAALVERVEIGQTNAQLVAVPTAMIDDVVTTAGGIIDRDALAATADVGADDVARSEPVPLGDDATGLRVRLDVHVVDGFPQGFNVNALLLDATGAPFALPLDGGLVFDADNLPQFTGDLDFTGYFEGESELPDGRAPWSLLAIATGLGPVAGGQITIEVADAESIGVGPLDVSGMGIMTGQNPDAVVWRGDGGVLAAAPPMQDGGVDSQRPPVLAVATKALASRLGVGPGDFLELRYAGTGRRVDVVLSSVVDAVPGASGTLALFAPLENLLTSQLQRGTSIVPPNSLWAAGDTGADAALSAAMNDRPVATSAPSLAASVVGALVPGWWIATAGSAVLSIVAAFAIVQTLAIARRRELGVLRAVGITPRRQARMRAAELGGVFGAALVLGAGAGVLVSWLVVPDLVRAVTPGILALAGGIDVAWTPLVIAVTALAVGLAAIVVYAATGVSRAARTATVGEESR